MKKKTKKNDIDLLVSEELDTTIVVEKRKPSCLKRMLLGCGIFCLALPLAFVGYAMRETQNISLSEVDTLTTASAPISAAAGKKGIISIPAGTENPNPFLPYRNFGEQASPGSDLPAGILVPPPSITDVNSDAARVMDTSVSGILYDKYSPTAILNIEGNDYLVKKGDVVNNYKVQEITQDSVTVKLGSNVYKAGIGEILTEGKLNHNEVSNLSNKFGGEK